MKRKDMDMTSGVIWRQILAFSFPLMLGNLFQQLYNTVDSIVVGQFVGKEALAAVGSVGPIMNTLIGFFMGLAAGAGVAISQAYGARDRQGVHDVVHTSFFLTAVMSVIITLVGVLFVPLMLRLMSTPDDVMPEASMYLRIYFAGASGLLFYNMGAGVLRSVGDSTRPLYFLIFSAVVNTILDLLFVVAFGMGIAGVALATITSQFLSAILTMWVLMREKTEYSLVLRDIRYNRLVMKKIINLGIPTAIQQAVTSFSNVFVQGYINYFGSACMAGWSSYSKIDQFVMLPMQGIALASTTFTGQNFGAGNITRLKRGALVSWGLGEAFTVVLMIPILIFAPQLVTMFNTDPDVVAYGSLFLRMMTPFYVLCVMNQTFAGSLRGAGKTRETMYFMLGSFVVFRQIYLFTISHICNTEKWIAMGYPFGWILASTLCVTYYWFSGWDKNIKTKNK